jgi:hypothetical protein
MNSTCILQSQPRNKIGIMFSIGQQNAIARFKIETKGYGVYGMRGI